MQATACTLSEGLSRPPLNYPGNLGRTCQSQIRTLANARAETFRKKSRQTRKVSIYFWPQSEVGARIASLLNELVSLLSIWPLPYRVSRTLLFLLLNPVALGATSRTLVIIKSTAIDTQVDKAIMYVVSTTEHNLARWWEECQVCPRMVDRAGATF